MANIPCTLVPTSRFLHRQHNISSLILIFLFLCIPQVTLNKLFWSDTHQLFFVCKHLRAESKLLGSEISVFFMM